MRLVLASTALIACCTSAARADEAEDVDRVLAFIQEALPKTVKTSASTSDPDVIKLPYPYTSPCIASDFKELFYWDTYFTNHGLVRAGMAAQAEHNVNDLLFLVDRFGLVPNANRLSMTNRSQTPLLSHMVHDLFALNKDTRWLESSYASLRREYEFWMTRRMSPAGLNRSGNSATREYLLEFFDYLENVRLKGLQLATDEEKLAFSRHALSEAETWDFNPRYNRRAEDFCAVDLNSCLYTYETNFARFSRSLGNREEPVWRERAERRKALIQELLWNESAGCFTDYDWKNARKGHLVSCATLYPLWAGAASPEQADQVVRKMREVLEYDCGLSTCEKRAQEFVYQWDYPNAWPPMQFIGIQALDRYGYKLDARRIARKYIKTVADNFERTGELWEKYNAVNGTVDVRDEYKMPPMVGWTAGVYLFAREYLQEPE